MVPSNEKQRDIKICVGRLPETGGSNELRQFFMRFGEVTNCIITEHRYAYIYMTHQEQAKKAIEAFHNTYGSPTRSLEAVDQSISAINMDMDTNN